MTTDSSRSTRPHVVILGAGFAGLYAARALRRAPVEVTVIDRSNHHLFQPLLYQVATASLSPADIARPIRTILRGQKNTRVILGEAKRVDLEARQVHLVREVIHYDWLILAAGARATYFGNDQWRNVAPGLKDVRDALIIRERFLLAFEAAERETDADVRRATLTFVIVGGGPTGVELAGAMAEVARRAMPSEFRSIDTASARIMLVEGGSTLLPGFAAAHAQRAKADLERLGVDVWLNARVTDIDEHGVSMGDVRIEARNVIWAAGVVGSSIAESLGVPLDKRGRVPVRPDLTIDGHPEVFVLGDLAAVKNPRTSAEVPGVAPAAMQMGRYAAKIIARETASWVPGLLEAGSESTSIQTPKPSDAGAAASHPQTMPASIMTPTPSRPPFTYRDRGMLATIGRARAVGTIGELKLHGLWAWILWCVVHIMYLAGYRNRLIVFIQWIWAYIWFERGARLITEPFDALTGEPSATSRSSSPTTH